MKHLEDRSGRQYQYRFSFQLPDSVAPPWGERSWD